MVGAGGPSATQRTFALACSAIPNVQRDGGSGQALDKEHDDTALCIDGK
jgi:hypothetical protein